MPAISMIGDSRMASRSRPTSLPAEPRSLARTLRLLQSPFLASDALLQSLDRIPKSAQRDIVRASVSETVESLREYNEDNIPPSVAEQRLSMTVELAVQKAFAEAPFQGVDDDDCTLPSLPPPPTSPPMTTQTKNLRPRSTAAAVVSDSSTVASAADDDDATLASLERVNHMRKFWALLLESLHLQVTSLTTTVWGRKKKYEIYKLSGVASLHSDKLEEMRARLEREFLSIFGGGQENELTCRTYALMRGSCVYLQINIGQWFDLNDHRNIAPTGEKKKKKDNEFIAIITPDDDMFALTASRAPSKSTYTKYVLAAIDAALVKMGDRVPNTKPKQVGHWSGDEPHELLEVARSTQTGRAVGRFAKFASEDVSDPLVEMHHVSTSSMIDRKSEQIRLARGARHGRLLAQSATTVERQGDTLVAANSNGLLVDSSAALHQSRKRARDQELGEKGNCPSLQRICWIWTGETSAAASCWLPDDEVRERGDELPKTKFKCALVLEGSNVMEGLRQMMSKGYATAPLPDFVRNAPTLGSSTITVSDGAYTGSEDSFAAV